MKDGFQQCYPCGWLYDGAADLVGSMIYGIDGTQSGKLMYGYKTTGSAALVQRVTSLVTLGLIEHFDCATALVGSRASRWATVPSLKNIGSEHPFRKILTPIVGSKWEIVVSAAEFAKNKTAQERRTFNPAFYEVETAIPPGTHVMLIDDTWASGAHIQSVAAALKAAGAAKVSALTVARWLDLSDPRTKRVFNEHIRPQPYDPAVCPWTAGDCPPHS